LLILIALCNCICAYGQTLSDLKIKGTIADSATNLPLGYTTVALADASTHVPVKSTLAKDNGSF